MHVQNLQGFVHVGTTLFKISYARAPSAHDNACLAPTSICIVPSAFSKSDLPPQLESRLRRCDYPVRLLLAASGSRVRNSTELERGAVVGRQPEIGPDQERGISIVVERQGEKGPDLYSRLIR